MNTYTRDCLVNSFEFGIDQVEFRAGPVLLGEVITPLTLPPPLLSGVCMCIKRASSMPHVNITCIAFLLNSFYIRKYI